MATSEKTRSSTAKKAATPVKTTAAKAAKAAAPTAKKPPAAKTPAAKSPAAKSGTRSPRKKAVNPEVRRHYVEVAAYYIAERRGFLGGCAHEDWLQAEVEIDRLLAENKLSA